MEEKEIWKAIAEFEGKYEVSNKGRVRSLWFNKIKQLKLINNKFGYYHVSLYDGLGNVTTKRVHCLVAEAFLSKRPNNYVINHKDGNKHNNMITNLEYVTSSQNNIHALKMGLRKPAHNFINTKRGVNHYRASVTEEQVIEILKYHYKTGFGCRKIGKIFNISRGVVNGILIGKTWKHIDRNAIKKGEI